MTKKNVAISLSLVLLVSLVVACGSTPTPVATEPPPVPGPTATTPAPEPTAEPTLESSLSELTSVVWKWEAYHEAGETPLSVNSPEDFTLVFFPGGQLHIQADCNIVGGTYVVDGSALTISLGPSTAAFCGEGSLDQQYLAYLGEVVGYSVDGEQLHLDLSDEASDLVFSDSAPDKAQPEASPPTDISGIVWEWEAFNAKEETQAPADSPDTYTLVFLREGQVRIQADCNTVGGTYTIEGDTLTIELGLSTMAFCGDESLDQQYLAFLVEAVGYGLESDRLILDLRDQAGTMVFRNGGPAEASGGIDQAAVTGTVVADGDAAFPDGATLEVKLMDVSLADAPATEMGAQVQEIGRLPAGFEVTFDPQAIDPRHTYGLSVRITDAQGKLLYINTRAFDVLTEGYPSHGVEVVVDPVAAPPPDAVEGPGAGTVGIDPAAITLDTMGLPYSWQANLVPATPYDDRQPPGPSGLPEHIQINFGGDPTARYDPSDRQPGDPVIYIIPVEAYRQLWEDNGDQGVGLTVDMQLEMLRDRPETFPTSGIPVLPFEQVGGYNDLGVQGSYPDLRSFGGLRFVGRFAQDPGPVTNGGLNYIFQGYAGAASDYVIAFFYPVTTEALPWPEDVSSEEHASVREDPGAYLVERAGMLNGLDSTDWEPDLALLDSVLGSLTFETISPGAGVIGRWEWLRSVYNNDTELTVDEPGNYTLEFKPDGRASIKADCNQLNWTYALEGSTLTFHALGASTVAYCGEESLDQQYMVDLSEVAGFVLHNGNLVLNIRAGVGSIVFAPAGPVD